MWFRTLATVGASCCRCLGTVCLCLRDGAQSLVVRVMVCEAQVCAAMVSGCGYAREGERDCRWNPMREQRDRVDDGDCFRDVEMYVTSDGELVLPCAWVSVCTAGS